MLRYSCFVLVLILVGCASNNSGPSRKLAEYYRASQSSAEALGWSDVRPYTAGYKIIRERNHFEMEQCQTVWATVGLYGFPDFYMARSSRVFLYGYLKEKKVISLDSVSCEQKNLLVNDQLLASLPNWISRGFHGTETLKVWSKATKAPEI